MIVVAIIALLATIAIPNFVKARATAQQTGCINNLQQMDGALQTWATENRKSDNAPIRWMISSRTLSLIRMAIFPLPGRRNLYAWRFGDERAELQHRYPQAALTRGFPGKARANSSGLLLYGIAWHLNC